ncbi:NEDD8-activating enzyme E1 regulatory subunit [Neocloeon triangulifer]|uniref:NEDD8-activating enzyme E1 regulatory subunit n=1 Tax=Neocloeon triangulifer TaxID=2078957 RepID=UPI00286F33E2|nr:NEDD8-activating enzyme E1 regulatory subunit [Neocloeon triangulifer]
MASPSPKSPEQSDKSKKYDRQIRLWGEHGQSRLDSCHVCLVNATTLGTEIMKSLVLPGIGAFTIVDGHTISEIDLETNFLLEQDSVGKSRAEVATKMLLELNNDVRGDFVDESVEQLLNNSPDFFDNFTVVYAVSLPERSLIPLSKKLWSQGIPLIVCKSYGMFGSIRIQVPEHAVVETHPEHPLPDLRLDKPFPSLTTLVDAINLSSMGLKDHAHIPYVVLLYKALQEYRKRHPDGHPVKRQEKDELKSILKEAKLKDEQGDYYDEENFEEAIRAVNAEIQPSRIPNDVKDILNDPCCINLTSRSNPFWIMARALKDFVDGEGGGLLPVRGSLPDMTAETSRYISLLTAYHDQAQRDVESVYRRAQQLLVELNLPPDTITEKDIKHFCKHSYDLHVVRGRSISDEVDPRSANTQVIASQLEDPDSRMPHYVIMRGIDRFYTEYNMYPGHFDERLEPDIVELKSIVNKLLGELGVGHIGKDDLIHEFCRYGGLELHSVSAFLGGCAAQEGIKFITSQYKPINNTFIYDAMTCQSSTFVL